ncbi:MAG: BMC domain-containing protein [Sphingorhabdus sp.]|jgi:ethanolamine utilization protein EutK|nr:BMC domain-containing protein [Sphingorhabdus sp.]
MRRNALGLIEVNGLVAAIEAADAMLKSATVRLSRRHVISPGLVTVVVEGDIASCRAAVDAGSAAAARVGQVIARLVIGRPDEDTRHLATPAPEQPEELGSQPPESVELLATYQAVASPVLSDQDDGGPLDAVEEKGRLLAYIAATQRGRTAQEVARHFKKHFGAVRSLLEGLTQDGHLQRKGARYVTLNRESPP